MNKKYEEMHADPLHWQNVVLPDEISEDMLIKIPVSCNPRAYRVLKDALERFGKAIDYENDQRLFEMAAQIGLYMLGFLPYDDTPTRAVDFAETGVPQVWDGPNTRYDDEPVPNRRYLPQTVTTTKTVR